MPFHVVAFGPQATPPAGPFALPPFSDPLIAPDGSAAIVPPGLGRVFACNSRRDAPGPWTIASSTLDPQLWRPVEPQDPNQTTTLLPNVADWRQYPLAIRDYADLRVLGRSDNNAQFGMVLLYLGSPGGRESLPAGEILHAAFSGALTILMRGWTSANMSFDAPLPRGRYALVGAYVNDPNHTYFRFVPTADQTLRPGGLVANSASYLPPDWQRNGGLGVWMEFDSVTPPAIELISPGFSTDTFTGVLDLIQLSSEYAAEPAGAESTQ